MKKDSLIYIQWADTTSPSQQVWWTKEEAKEWAKNDSYWIEQTGYLLEETKEYLLLAGGKSTTKTGTDIIQYHLIVKIPKPLILKRKRIK